MKTKREELIAEAKRISHELDWLRIELSTYSAPFTWQMAAGNAVFATDTLVDWMTREEE